jgi:hypothetical protein
VLQEEVAACAQAARIALVVLLGASEARGSNHLRHPPKGETIFGIHLLRREGATIFGIHLSASATTPDVNHDAADEPSSCTCVHEKRVWPTGTGAGDNQENLVWPVGMCAGGGSRAAGASLEEDGGDKGKAACGMRGDGRVLAD